MESEPNIFPPNREVAFEISPEEGVISDETALAEEDTLIIEPSEADKARAELLIARHQGLLDKLADR